MPRSSGILPLSVALRRRMSVASGGLFLAVIVLAVVLHHGVDGAWAVADRSWLALMVDARQPVPLSLAYAFNEVGAGLWGAVIIPSVSVCVVFLVRGPRSAGYLVTVMILATLVTQLLKRVVARPRPEGMLVTSDFGSFPSGHSVQAVVWVVALGLLFPYVGVWVAGALYALAMMWSRTYLGVHWLTDVLGAAALGCAVALACYAGYGRWLRNERRPRVSTSHAYRTRHRRCP
ncbi:hypothetical protein GCM10022198_02720 [Klugiella xanthotipulae]|nr:phosphatase PAP2 family protein [Klugiella xanthotipulae]